MIADWRPRVCDVSLFEIADAPMNWYIYLISEVFDGEILLKYFSTLFLPLDSCCRLKVVKCLV